TYQPHSSYYSRLLCYLILRRPQISTLFPYTTLFRSITLSSMKKFNFNPSLDVTHSNIQDFGIEGNVSVSSRNIFKGAEVLQLALDRKSTRLNSSHVKISYAVFCLKKKKKQKDDDSIS